MYSFLRNDFESMHDAIATNKPPIFKVHANRKQPIDFFFKKNLDFSNEWLIIMKSSYLAICYNR